MKKTLFFLIALFWSSIALVAQTNKVFDSGEYFKFKISYGIINAGVATLKLSDTVINGTSLYHAKGYGYTTGATKFFFKVEDDYQSYFEKKQVKPHQFIRKIDEGGYTKNQQGFFNYKNNTVLVKDFEKNKENTYPIHNQVQDIVSAFYYLRKHPKIKTLKSGESIEIDMFFDGEIFTFKLKYLGNEKLKTKFGTLETMKFQPYVQAGRVFKAKESLMVWVTADENKVPVRVRASLLVGSLKAELEDYKGLVNPLKKI